MYLRGQRVDMQALAAELGISRTTLYRWTGQREQLLSDILWSLSDDIFEQAKRDHPKHSGTKRLLAIFRQHVGALVEAEPLHIFLQQETQAALRILTSPTAGVQSRTVSKLADLYREEVQAEAPPSQEAAAVGAGVLVARVGQAIEPAAEVGEEVAGGLDQGAAGDQGRPALSFRNRALARSRATVSWWISRRRSLRRLCSASHERTSGSRYLGT